jgi:hypothetical protein
VTTSNFNSLVPSIGPETFLSAPVPSGASANVTPISTEMRLDYSNNSFQNLGCFDPSFAYDQSNAYTGNLDGNFQATDARNAGHDHGSFSNCIGNGISESGIAYADNETFSATSVGFDIPDVAFQPASATCLLNGRHFSVNPFPDVAQSTLRGFQAEVDQPGNYTLFDMPQPATGFIHGAYPTLEKLESPSFVHVPKQPTDGVEVAANISAIGPIHSLAKHLVNQ